MSGWFGTGNPELNDPFYGIQAGYARRKSHQSQRYKSMGRMTIDQMAQRNRAAAAQRKAPVATKTNGDTTQKYLGYDIVTTYVDPLRTYSTKVKKGGITKKTTQGSSKGQAVNAAKNWVDSQVVTKVDPSIQRAVEAAEKKAAQQAAKVVKQETEAQKKQAFREAEAASVKANRVAKKTEAQKMQAFREADRASMQANKVAKAPAATQEDKMRAFREADRASMQAQQVKKQSDAEKMRAFREAEAASVAAQKKAKAAQASEAARFQRAAEAQKQKLLNEEMSKRSMFTESSVSPAKMMPNTSSADLADQNRQATLNQMRNQFQPVQMPNDFVAGKYTVRAAYNPGLKNYVVSVREGNIALESKTYGMREGDAAKNKFNTFKSLVTKKAKYDGEVSKVDSKGLYDIELQVIQASVASVSGGFLSGLMNMFGLGRMTVDQIAERNRSKSRSRAVPSGPDPSIMRRIEEAKSRGRAPPAPSPMSRPVPSGPDPSIMRRIEEAKQAAAKKRPSIPSGPDASILRRMEEARKAAETPSMVPQAVRSRTQSMSTKQVIPSGPDASIVRAIDNAKKASLLKANWDKMPAKKFKVVVKRKDGSVAKESAEMGDYTKALEVYESELLTVANNPDFYDKSQVLIPEAPVADGSGGDITQTSGAIPPTPTIGFNPAWRTPGDFYDSQEYRGFVLEEQRIRTQFDLSREEALARDQIAAQMIEEIVYRIATGGAAIVAQESASGSENYNTMVDAAPVQTYPQPVSTYQTTALPDNEYVIRQQSQRETAVAIDKNNSTLLLGAAALAGAVYLARK